MKKHYRMGPKARQSQMEWKRRASDFAQTSAQQPRAVQFLMGAGVLINVLGSIKDIFGL